MSHAIGGPPPPSHVFMHYRIYRSTNRKDRQPVREREQRQDREPEVGHREEEERDAAQDAVRRGPAARDLDERDEDAEGEASDERDEHEEQRIRNRASQNFTNRTLVRERPSQLSVREGIHVLDELLGQR